MVINIYKNKQTTVTILNLVNGPIMTYIWKVDDTIQNNNTGLLTIPANTFTVGTHHTIKLTVINECGSSSIEKTEDLNVIDCPIPTCAVIVT